MPQLIWTGKEKVVNHHLDVPFHTLKAEYIYPQKGKKAADPSGNLIIHGDNLLALKALLPRYESRVKLIYIDPPYNTGNENWVYNDNVNDPKIKKWIGEVVGKEGEDLSRHDKWLCMMYPRLKLLQKLLREDGAIFISIDDNEQANLRLICDEVFGKNNFVANIVWKHTQQSKNDEKHFSRQYNYILVYSKSIDYLDRFLFDRTEEDNINYSNPDNDPNGLWRSGDVRSPNYRKTLCFPLFTPDKKKINPPKNGWRWSEESIKEKIMKGEIIFKPGGLGIIRKIYLKDQSGRTPENLWDDEIYGTTRQATALLKEIFEGNTPFNTPKPIQLLDRIIQIASTPNDIILDSFAGSGTTAHAVLNMNKDGGNRKFILVEMEDYAETITAERIRRVISGYGEGDKKTPGTGGDFTYCALGEPIFTPDGSLNPKAGEDALWRYIWYAETKTSMPDSEKTRTNQYYLGSFLNIAYYFYYNKERKTVLDYAFLKTIKKKEEQYIIYADICTLGAEYLNARNIHFRKIPRDIPRY